MAEQKDEKSKLPLTGMVALVLAVVSSLIIYQVPLKTSRPIDKEAEKNVSVSADRVQSRLWQDPFEAVSTHQLKEAGSKPDGERIATSHHAFHDLVKAIQQAGAPSDFRVLPVFVDGSPYANGVESRLKDRYAVVSALGAAGYMPESGEYIRFFEWQRQSGPTLVVPIEWFIPKPHIRSSQHVLILWLKDQDFSPNPLLSLGHLVVHLNGTLGQESTRYRVLSPRTSGTLRAMLSELKDRHHKNASEDHRLYPSWATPDQDLKALKDLVFYLSWKASNQDFKALKGIVFYSSWATAADTFLLGDSPREASERGVEELFTHEGLSLIRTIGTDAVLAEQLVEELKRRNVDLSIPRDVSKDCKVPHVALISEWDTLYGRALPRTVVAVAENMAKSKDGKIDRNIEHDLNTLRTDEWPCWVHQYSYLAGLDGELPPKGDGKEAGGSQTKGKSGDKGQRGEPGMEEAPAGRGQLDYVRRLAETLKREATTIDGEFKAIGVLGSDVYDKLMILQALRSNFPRAIFFTTDLDARMTHPAQWQWTRNLVVASHFGLELHPKLQTPIPPFRDSYQTALFYSALQALGHIVSDPATGEWQISTKVTFPSEVKPRLYEVGRHGAVDISPDSPNSPDRPRGAPASIHLPRPDLDPDTGKPGLLSTRTMVVGGSAITVMMLCMVLINSELWAVLRTRWFGIVVLLAVFAGAMGGLLMWAMSDGTAGEPFILTDGISVWPTATIRLVAFVLCLIFIWYSSRSLRANDRALARRFRFMRSKAAAPVIPYPVLGIHYWRSRPGRQAPAMDLWQEYQSLGGWKDRVIRIVPQTLCYGLFGVLLMLLFGFPTMPCRGPVCVKVNYLILLLSVIGMTLLMFYVVDATRLCRRLIKVMIAAKIQWPDRLLEKEAVKRGVDKAYLHEWFGIELIARRTAVISSMLYSPFVILFLMGVARHTYFDRWDFPVGLMAIFSLNAAYAFGNAVFLRRSAEEAKRTAITQLKAKLIGLPDESAKRKQVERMADLIDNNREGAFLPFTQHPLFGAIALPTGGTGLVLLIEYLATIL